MRSFKSLRQNIPVVLLSCLIVGLCGCSDTAPWRATAQRSKSSIDRDLEAESKPKEASSTEFANEVSKETKGFFKANRRAGTWSSEAREIEASLGVPD